MNEEGTTPVVPDEPEVTPEAPAVEPEVTPEAPVAEAPVVEPAPVVEEPTVSPDPVPDPAPEEAPALREFRLGDPALYCLALGPHAGEWRKGHVWDVDEDGLVIVDITDPSWEDRLPNPYRPSALHGFGHGEWRHPDEEVPA